jgi:hypothetical protein
MGTWLRDRSKVSRSSDGRPDRQPIEQFGAATGTDLRHHLDRAGHAEHAVKKMGAFESVRSRRMRH